MPLLPKHLPSVVAMVASALLAGCGDAASLAGPADASADASAARGASNCENFAVDGIAALGPVQIAGINGFGAVPTPVTIAGASGVLGSVITGMETSGKNGQGAQHITLVHSFVSPQGTFTTTDRAVCAPAGGAGTCRVNDVLTVASGTGIFANAAGSMRNHGIIDLVNSTVTIALRGRICGAGL